MKVFLAKSIIIYSITSIVYGAVIYENDFDGNTTTDSGVTVNVSGGTDTGGGIAGGTTYSQGYDNASYPEFSGDFWRITASEDVLTFQVTGLDPTETINLSFALAMLDSWDGTSTQYGTDILNVAILDGGNITENNIINGTTGGNLLDGFSQTFNNSNNFNGIDLIESEVVLSTQLGFNTGSQSWWNDDGYTVAAENLVATSGTLTFAIWASGTGFQGGNDESFAIDNLLITSNVPEPSTGLLIGFTFITSLFRRCRQTPTHG